MTSPTQNRGGGSLLMSDDNGKKSLEKRLSISSSDSDRESQSSLNFESVKESKQDDTQKSDNSTNEIFDGKQSFFSEEVAENSSGRSRSSKVLTKKISLPTFNSAISIDDSIDSNFEIATSTQVWTFGKNSYGQLGHGDLDDRYIEFDIFFIRYSINASTYNSI